MHASYMQLSLSNITMSFLDVGSVVFGGVGGIVAFNYVCEARNALARAHNCTK